MMGAASPIFSNPMFGNLGGGGKAGIAWGNTLLGCLTVVFIPIP
jgi:DHA1 family multidrug resistance protein-like MFS transporter